MTNFTNALKLLEEKKAKTYLSTGCADLDRLIGKGVEPGVFYLFYGDLQSGIDLLLHQLMASALSAEDRTSKVVYLNCGNYREEKTIFDIPSLVHVLKVHKLDSKESLDRVLVFCAFSEEQQEQVVEEVRQTIKETREVKLLVIHNIAKLFTTENKRTAESYKRIPRLQRVVLRLWQTCASQGVAMVASCKPVETQRGRMPKPEGGRYLSHEANVIVYLEKVGGLVPTPQAYLLKHPAKPHGRVVLRFGGDSCMGRITVPFNQRFQQELEDLKEFRDALKDPERQVAFDQIVKVCTSEQGAMANSKIPDVLGAMLLAVEVDNRRLIEYLQKRIDSLEESIRKLKATKQVC